MSNPDKSTEASQEELQSSGNAEKQKEKKGKKSIKEKISETVKAGKSKEKSSAKIKALEARVKEAEDKHLRLLAEFDNFRRRNAKESLELQMNASKALISDLLPIIDDMKRAEKSGEASEDIPALRDGFKLIQDKFLKLLTSKGLQSMDSKGKDFDPEMHEALTEIPAPEKSQIGKVIDVVEEGFFLNDKIIRYAKVVVGK